ncbi:hypothetical protein GALMADRAFT_209033 [Galerina marginata CBS 339.88]|uniref:Uncharacterized protein n=1 Tax=Galerina marginata (strain CBS 339.88) TaxID=685588 RepID=A0A067T8A7_GALM3|nr:hypothetical protein GALMADRAFT_209033 [Galerina marginata CBS 339.88]
MADKPGNLTALENQYEPLLIFIPDKDRGNLWPQLDWTVRKVFLVSTGASYGHWRILLQHDDESHGPGRRTFFNMKNAQKGIKTPYGQLHIGGGPLPDTHPMYELPISDHHNTVLDYINAILYPSADATDGVHAEKPMCWFKFTNHSSGTRGCRHWIEAAARVLHRAGLLKPDVDISAIIKEKGMAIEERPAIAGEFLTRRPTDQECKEPELKD